MIDPRLKPLLEILAERAIERMRQTDQKPRTPPMQKAKKQEARAQR